MAFYDEVHSTKKYRLGTRKRDVAGNEYIYLKGVTSNAAGKWVSFTSAYTAVLLAADAVGSVAVSMAAFDAATEYGWAQIYGANTISSSDTVAGAGALYIDGTAGRVDDADVAGDSVHGAFSTAADTSNVLPVWLNYPFVTNIAHD
jgi:hypothetical protein